MRCEDCWRRRESKTASETPTNTGFAGFSSESSGPDENTSDDSTSDTSGFAMSKCGNCSKVLETLFEIEKYLDAGRLDKARELLRESYAVFNVKCPRASDSSELS